MYIRNKIPATINTEQDRCDRKVYTVEQERSLFWKLNIFFWVTFILKSQNMTFCPGTALLPAAFAALWDVSTSWTDRCSWGKQLSSLPPPSFPPSFLAQLTDSNPHLNQLRAPWRMLPWWCPPWLPWWWAVGRPGNEVKTVQGSFLHLSVSLLFLPLRACLPAQSPEACWEL